MGSASAVPAREAEVASAPAEVTADAEATRAAAMACGHSSSSTSGKRALSESPFGFPIQSEV